MMLGERVVRGVGGWEGSGAEGHPERLQSRFQDEQVGGVEMRINHGPIFK